MAFVHVSTFSLRQPIIFQFFIFTFFFLQPLKKVSFVLPKYWAMKLPLVIAVRPAKCHYNNDPCIGRLHFYTCKDPASLCCCLYKWFLHYSRVLKTADLTTLFPQRQISLLKLANRTSHFRVVVNLIMKARLSTKGSFL